jgi:hypothetical protein
MNEEMNELREAAGLTYALSMLGEFEEVTMNNRRALEFFYTDWEKLWADSKGNPGRFFIRELSGAKVLPENHIIVISSALADYFHQWGLEPATESFSNKERVTVTEDAERFMLVVPKHVLETKAGDGWALEAPSQMVPLVLPFGVSGTIIRIPSSQSPNMSRDIAWRAAGQMQMQWSVFAPPHPPSAFIRPAA